MRTFGRRLPGTIGLQAGGLDSAIREGAMAAQRERAIAPAATMATQAGPTALSLAANAFAVLGIPLESTQDRISLAVEDLAFEVDRDEAVLQAARASLFSARDRLAQEIAWLPECSAQQQEAAGAMARRGDRAGLLHLAARVQGLARINLLEAGADLRSTDVQPALDLVEAIGGWQPDGTLDRIDEARGRGGFRPVDVDQWELAVTGRLREVAARLGPLIAASPDGRARLTGVMHRAAEAGTTLGAFLEALQASYAAAIQEPLGRLEMRIRAAVDLIEANPGDAAQVNGQVNGLIAALNQWSAYRRPIQVMEAARSLDDRESARIFEMVLQLSITVANSHDMQALALRLAEALRDGFSHLPQQRKRLEQQMPVLLGNVAMQRLIDCAQRIEKQRSRFVSAVKSHRMGPRSKGLAGELIESFAAVLDAAGESRDVPFRLARTITIGAYNRTRDRQAAIYLFEWMLSEGPPPDMREQLQQDLRRMRRRGRRSGILVALAVVFWTVARCHGPPSAERHKPVVQPSGGQALVPSPTRSQRPSAAEESAVARAAELARIREEIRQSNAEAERVRAANDALRAQGMRREWEEAPIRPAVTPTARSSTPAQPSGPAPQAGNGTPP